MDLGDVYSRPDNDRNSHGNFNPMEGDPMKNYLLLQILVQMALHAALLITWIILKITGGELL